MKKIAMVVALVLAVSVVFAACSSGSTSSNSSSSKTSSSQTSSKTSSGSSSTSSSSNTSSEASSSSGTTSSGTTGTTSGAQDELSADQQEAYDLLAEQFPLEDGQTMQLAEDETIEDTECYVFEIVSKTSTSSTTVEKTVAISKDLKTIYEYDDAAAAWAPVEDAAA